MAKDPDLEFIRLPPRALEDIAVLASNSQHVLAIAQQSSAEHAAASIVGFSSRIAPKIGLDVALVAEIAAGLWNLKNLQKNTGLPARAFVELLERSIRVYARERWKKEHFDAFRQATNDLAAALDALIDDHPLLISAKANTLAYAQQNLFTNARIITDVRPIFDTAGEKIIETVIIHSLAINYVGSGHEQRLMTFALDSADIAALRNSCERAERKEKVAKENLKPLNPVSLPEKLGS